MYHVWPEHDPAMEPKVSRSLLTQSLDRDLEKQILMHKCSATCHLNVPSLFCLPGYIEIFILIHNSYLNIFKIVIMLLAKF